MALSDEWMRGKRRWLRYVLFQCDILCINYYEHGLKVFISSISQLGTFLRFDASILAWSKRGMNMYICPCQGGRTYLEARQIEKALEAKCVMGLCRQNMSLEFFLRACMSWPDDSNRIKKKNPPPLLLFLTKVG